MPTVTGAGGDRIDARLGTGGLGGTGGMSAGGSGGAAGGPGGGGGLSPPGSGGSSTGGSAGSGGVAGRGMATGGAGGGGGLGGTPADPDLVLWYKFDESTGATATDSSAASGGPRNGTLAVLGTGGAAGFTTISKIGTHALVLAGNGTSGGGYVMLPSIYPLAPTAITLAAWVFETSDADWQRVFDIGTGTTVQMFLATRENKDSNHDVRFVITTTGGTAEQFVQSNQVISLNAWHHLAVTLQAGSPYTGTLYIDGAVAGTNAAMTLHPSDLGVTTQNYIGKSQYSNDPYMTGEIDDFRVYQRALTAAEVAALYAARSP